jgi:hypothetical protein
MNWAELRALDASGVMDVQAHGLTHTWYPSGPVVADVHRPRRPDPYPWLAWNERPERKYKYLNEDQQPFVAWGTPVLEHEKALTVRRFHPHPDELRQFAAQARERLGNGDTGDGAGADDLLDGLIGRKLKGWYESAEEQRLRIFGELRTARDILEEKLTKRVRFLSWPGGGVSELGRELAREAGYDSWTLSSWDRPSQRNRPGVPAEGIKRLSGRGVVYWRGRRLCEGDARVVLQRLLAHQGSMVARIGAGVQKLRLRLQLGPPPGSTAR